MGKSNSRRGGQDGFEEMAERLWRQAAPTLARALNLDRAEAAANVVLEVGLAARAFMRALPMPAESRQHLDKAEQELLRAARLAVRGIDARRKGRSKEGARKVVVDFASDRSGTRSKRPRAP
jgi:hypothetical protein